MAASDDENQSPAVRVTLRDIWTKQEEMAQTLQTVVQAVTPLTSVVVQLGQEKLGVADYKYERDMRDHQTGVFTTDVSLRLRDLELWRASKTGVSSVLTTALYAFGGAGAAFLLSHFVK